MSKVLRTYKINGDIVKLIIKCKNGTFTTIFDSKFYEEFINKNWTVKPSHGNYYICYWTTNPNKCVFMHRLVAKTVDNKITDHINGDTLDNREENLRVCDYIINNRNRKTFKKNKTGCNGVKKIKERFHSYIYINKKRISLGSFDNLDDAIQSKKEAEIKYWGNYYKLEQENTQLKQQLEVAEKMIELMAKTIFALSHKTKSVEKCINNFKQQALSQMQKVGE